MTLGDERRSSWYTARCTCGYRIACELSIKDDRLGVVCFFDNEETSETYGEQVEHCPSCGIKVGLPEILSKKNSAQD